MSRVRLENVSKSFDHTQAVLDLSLDIKDGEFVVLLGPSGAGKTTTLRLIAGLEKPDQGSVYISDQNVTTFQPAERNIAFVFQQYSLYPNYTVYDNLAFPLKSPLRNIEKGEIDKKVRQVAKMLHIESKLDNKSTNLSGGEMQRVAIGRALVRDPNIFLMDEPLSSLDAKLREELRVELKNIQVNLGATLLYVTHDHVEATTMGDRIGVLKEGELIQIDIPKNIYEKPNSIYVANSLGSPRINIIPTDIVEYNLPKKVKYVGFRPEDVTLDTKVNLPDQIETVEKVRFAGFSPEGNCSDGVVNLSAVIESKRCLGVEEVILMEFRAEKLCALVRSGDKHKPHDKINFKVAWDNMLFFDQHSQRIEL